jgi:folate-dependent phosphoribosylglycinamide formyltransferase PurN
VARIVLITPAGGRGRLLLDTFHRRGVPLDAVLLLAGDLGPPPARPGESGVRRLVRWPRGAWRTLRRTALLHGRWYRSRCRVRTSGSLDSTRLRRDLRRLAPDYVALGGCGIVRPDLIAIARAAVLNTHPALLPWIRGSGVVGYSLAAGVALGATVHHVDAGIDTGAIVARRLMPVPPGPSSLLSLERAADAFAADLMVDVVAGIRRGEHPAVLPQPERHPLHRLDAAALDRPAHEALARAGRAGELFERWLARLP